MGDGNWEMGDERCRERQEKMVVAGVERELRGKNLNIKRERDIKK
jgi:hypothetical protein